MGEFIPVSKRCIDQGTNPKLWECQKQVEMDSFGKGFEKHDDFG
jgi:hypothetical protein